MKKVILWVCVVLWMIIIFLFSNMNSISSNDKSKKVIDVAIEQSINVTNSIGVTKNYPSQSKKSELVEELNVPLRKCAHSTIYFVLATFLLLALSQSISKRIIIVISTFIISFIYACTDEFHQLYVSGRTGQFSDVIIDMIGVVLACIMFIVITRVVSKYKKKEKYS